MPVVATKGLKALTISCANMHVNLHQAVLYPHSVMSVNSIIDILNHPAGEEPLYPGASISCRDSWTSIYKFSISNRLTDTAMQQLLNLISSHCPVPNFCPKTVHKLKKHMGSSECVHSQFCNNCNDLIPFDRKECENCTESTTCYFTLLPFEEHLKEIFTGR